MSRNHTLSSTRKIQYACLALFAVAVLLLAYVAFARVAQSGPAAGATPNPVPTYGTTEPDTPQQVTATRKDGTLRTLFAGDSLTGGLYASEQSKAFKWLMLDSLQATGPVEEFNSALSGGTTIQVSEQYPVPAGLDLAVVELGTNDLGNVVPLDEFRTSYAALIEKIKAGSPDVALVCAGVWEGNGGGPEGPTYDRVIEQACTDAGGVFVSLRTIYQQSDTIGPVGLPAYLGTSDDFHPNDAGHAAIAAALLEQITVQ